MSESHSGWVPDLSSVAHVDLVELATLALYARAGETAIKILQRGRGGRTDLRLRIALADQGFKVLEHISAPKVCTELLANIRSGVRPTESLEEVAGMMRVLAETLHEEYLRRERLYNDARGVRDL